MKLAIIWLAKNNIDKCIAEASQIIDMNMEGLNVSLFIVDRQNSSIHSSKAFTSNGFFYIYKSCYTSSIVSDYCDVIIFSNSNYILPITDDDPVNYKGLQKMVENFGKIEKPNKAIYMPVPLNPIDGSQKINNGSLKSASQYSFWQYMNKRAANIAFYSLLSSAHILKAYSLLNVAIFEKHWLNPLWDQFFVWLLVYLDPQSSIITFDDFYLHYDNANWSDRQSIIKTRNAYYTSSKSAEISLTYLFFSICVKINPLELLRWSCYLLKRLILYRELCGFFELSFKLLRLNIVNLFRNSDETYC